MPLTLVADIGGAASNAYADVDAAETAAAYRVGGNAAAWLELDTDQQIQTLVTATRDIDTVPFKGARASAEQALEWPRTGTAYAADALPAMLVAATIELAFSYAPALADGATDTDVLNPDISGGRIKRERTGPLETEYFEAPAPVTDLAHFPTIVQRLLAPLVWLATATWGSSTAVRAS